MSNTTEIPTREDLARLLSAKDAAQRAYSASRRAAFEGKDGSTEMRLTLDIAERAALKASCAADVAYNDALDRFMTTQPVAA